MDNVTHSLVGLLMGEAALRIYERRVGNPASVERLRTPAMLVSILGNNAPDADAFYASVITRPLGSLLHHRGHTHTFTLVPVLALLTVLVALGMARLRGVRFERQEVAWLSGVGVAAVAAHIAFDATNSYGVHPFWPFHNGWFYGDTVFIVEPLLWSVIVPPLVFSVRSRWLKILLAGVVVVGAGLCWWIEFVPAIMAAAVTLLGVGFAIASRRATPVARVATSAGGALAITLTFAATGALARNEVQRASASAFPRGVTHDIVLTPLPANPLCWQALLVQTEGERYAVRNGMVALLPAVLTSDDCAFDVWGTPTAPSRPIFVAPTSKVRWSHEFSAPRRELEVLARENCVFAALLRFTRAPFWTHDDDLGRVAGDIRYDRSAGLDFADTVLDGVPCPRNVPPWVPPRRELLGR